MAESVFGPERRRGVTGAFFMAATCPNPRRVAEIPTEVDKASGNRTGPIRPQVVRACPLRHRELLDPAIAWVRDEDIAGRIDGDPGDGIRRRREELSIATAWATPPRQERSVVRKLLDTAVANVGDENVAGCVHRDIARVVKLTVARALHAPSSDEGSVTRELANTLGQRSVRSVPIHRNENIPARVDRDTVGGTEGTGRACGPPSYVSSVICELLYARPMLAVSYVGDENVAAPVH